MAAQTCTSPTATLGFPSPDISKINQGPPTCSTAAQIQIAFMAISSLELAILQTIHYLHGKEAAVVAHVNGCWQKLACGDCCDLPEDAFGL